MKHLKKLIFAFFIAFALNFVWENLHSFLYIHYKGGEITEFILLRASLVDALIIFFLILPFVFLKKHSWLIILGGVIIAIIIELFALYTNRWNYTDTMPIIPIVNIGLTPTVQLGLLGYLTYNLIFKWYNKLR